MVTVFFRGGLGNQMFQYAAGFSLAKKLGVPLMLDTVHVRDRFPRPNFTFRKFDLPNVFDIQSQYTPLSRAAASFPIPGLWLGLDLFLMNLAQAAGNATIVYEDERKGFQPINVPKTSDVILYGRWENEKYFQGTDVDLRKEFRFKHPLEGQALELAQEIEKTDSVAVHVRRGDFAASKVVAGMMGSIGSDYYARAIECIAQRVPSPHFFVFSDDIEWCKQNLAIQFPVTYAEPSTSGPRAAFHLELMSRCKHNIIANSTFSWWGAWLNANPQKIVIAPKRWYADVSLAGDIVPSSWTTL